MKWHNRYGFLVVLWSIVSGGIGLLGVMLMVISVQSAEASTVSFFYSLAMAVLFIVGFVLALAGNLGVIVCGFLFWSSCRPYQRGSPE